MAKPIAQVQLGEGDPVSVEDLLGIELFKDIAERVTTRFPGSITQRRFKAGEVVCREGDFGSTAYFIVSGEVTVSIGTPMAHVESSGGSGGLLGRIKSALVGTVKSNETRAAARTIAIDAPVNLSSARPLATLSAGSLFGEMTCLSFYPRSATVVAKTDCVILEMLRNVLLLLKKEPSFRQQLEADYRARAMDAHLRSVPLLGGLSDEFLARLRSRVSLVSYEPGEVICRQGEEANAFFLIRIGFVSVSRAFPAGDVVLTYLSRGHAFGEMGLLGEGVREATCTALDNVEVVCIGEQDFRQMTEEFPEIRERLELMAKERREANKVHSTTAAESQLDDFLEQGLMQAQSLLVIDLHSCTRCDDCVRACADTHDGVTRLLREGLRFDQYLVATSCRQCRDPVCMVGCPVGAIRRNESLEIAIEDWCIGCGLCANQCPYGNINIHPFVVQDRVEPTNKAVPRERKKAITCDLCAHLTEPACVAACPEEAAFRVEPRAFFSTHIGKR
jgi:CRP-like cAMP-binding protein/Fe-S-cluster-containing hydrogenase component 2